MKALALHAAGNVESANELADTLAENYPDNANVQLLVGTVLHASSKTEAALALLGRHQGDLEAYVFLFDLGYIR